MKNFSLFSFAILFILFFSYLIFINSLPLWYLYLFMGINAISFLFYGMDKWAAIKQWQRTPELHFYLLALFFGWPGSLIGQTVFNHKTTKQRFRIIFFIMMGLNLSLLVWYLLTL